MSEIVSPAKKRKAREVDESEPREAKKGAAATQQI